MSDDKSNAAKKEGDSDASRSGWFWLGVALCVVIASGALWELYRRAAISWYSDATERGQFGDMFGGLNAFTSSAAMILALVAILLQTEELREARRDRQQSLDTAEDQKEVFRTQLEMAREAAAAQTERLSRECSPSFLIDIPRSIALGNSSWLILKNRGASIYSVLCDKRVKIVGAPSEMMTVWGHQDEFVVQYNRKDYNLGSAAEFVISYTKQNGESEVTMFVLEGLVEEETFKFSAIVTEMPFEDIRSDEEKYG